VKWVRNEKGNYYNEQYDIELFRLGTNGVVAKSKNTRTQSTLNKLMNEWEDYKFPNFSSAKVEIEFYYKTN